MRRTRLWLGLALTLVAGVSVPVAMAVRAGRAADREAGEEVGLARREREAGRPDLGARRLARLEAARPGRAEVAFERAQCELARGRADAALGFLDKVPPGSPEADRAAAPRARAEILRGRLADAEAVLTAALDRPGAGRREARDALVRLLRSEGRFAEARRVFVDGFAEWPDPADGLRALHRLDVDPFPADGVRVYLERAARLAPGDDRVALGLAHLSTRLGRFEEAERRLDACLERRPHDPAVWRARLDWARLADRPEAAAAALAHLPADPAEAEDLRAWFAARRGDPAAERAALGRLIELDPGRVAPLDRLAELAASSDSPGVALKYRERQAALNRDREAYQALVAAGDPRAHAAELAGLAASLGLRTESREWARLAGVSPPKLPTVPLRAGRTLADLLPEAAGVAAAPARHAETAPAPPAPRFADDADAAGLKFTHESGSSGDRLKLIPPLTFSGGVGLLDVDSDGWIDVYCVQGGSFPPDFAYKNGDRLYRNRGDGTFEDATERAGLAAVPGGYGHGVAVGDVDNDGRPDLFVTRWRSYALYRNKGDGTFEDATERFGLGGDRDWPTSAAFADLDGDGDLDLYVCHYLRWDDATARACVDPRDPSKYHCAPRDFEAKPDQLFRNDGGKVFTDVTADAGIADADGRGLGVVAADLDGDGRVDLYVANDTTANYLWRNLGGLKFEEVALTRGAAGNASGGYQAGMGVACGDLDGDGLPDLAVTNFYGESTTFFRNLGGGVFADHTAAAGLAAPSRHLLGFGVAFLDADNDGRLDLLTANGHVHDGRPQFPWAMPAQLLRGAPGGKLVDASARAGPPFEAPHLGRGLAAGDLDNDGRVDALLVAQDEPLVYLHNATPGAGRSLSLRLEGKPPGSNRDAVGTSVTVEAGRRRRTAWRTGGGSFQSAGDPRLHFGLGAAERADRIEVRWPSGRLDVFEGLAPGAYTLREGDEKGVRNRLMH